MKMTREILKFCIERGILLDKDSLNLLDEFDENTARNIIEKISCLKEKIITKSFFSDNVEKIQEMIEDKGVIDKLRINLGLSLEISRQRFVKKHEIEEGSEEESEEEEKRAEREFRVEHLKITNSLANLTRNWKWVILSGISRAGIVR